MTVSEIKKRQHAEVNDLYAKHKNELQTVIDNSPFKVGDLIHKKQDFKTIYKISRIFITGWEAYSASWYEPPYIVIKIQRYHIKRDFASATEFEASFDDCSHFIPSEFEAKKESKPTYEYLIQAGDIYKIGFSNNPDKRLHGIQTSNPHKCEMLFKIRDPHGTLEKDLHSKFSLLRMQGEWFQKDKRILDEFQKLSRHEQHRDNVINLFSEAINLKTANE